MDIYGDHALVCKKGNDLIKRHDNIVRLLAEEMKSINIKYEIEPRNLITYKKARPADIRTDGLFHNEITWLDVGITHTLYPKDDCKLDLSDLKINQNANKYFLRKIDKYKKFNLDNLIGLSIDNDIKLKIKYRPFVIETDGSIIKETKEILQQIIQMKVIKTGKDRGELHIELLRRIIAQLNYDILNSILN